MSLKFGNNSGNSLVNASLQIHRACTCGNVLQTNIDDSLCENCSGSSTVTCLLVSLGSDFLYHLCTHIGESVLKFNFLSDSHTVLSNLRSTELLVNDNVTALRSECNLYCICKSVCALFHFCANVNVEFDIFCHNNNLLKLNLQNSHNV